MLRKIAATLAIVGVLAGFGAFGALSIFTSTASVPANAFTTGTVDISTSPDTALVTYSNMAPGDVVTAPLTVTNGGTLDLRYAMTTSADNPDSKGLRDQLVLTIKTIDVTTPVTPCDDFDGTELLYTGALSGGVIGDPAQHAQGGDRPLADGANEVLCFKVELPSDTDDDYQGATTTATFTFDAEQTVNN
jgi:hypothetical protein